MIIVKNRLIFGVIKKIILSVFKALFAVLSLFNLQATVLCALLGVVLYFTGAFERSNALLIAYYFVFIASVVLAIYLTIKKLLGLGGKNKKRRKPEIVNDKNDYKTDGRSEKNKAQESRSAEKRYEPEKHYPLYYEVRQNRNYIMAEYCDRYELYFKDKNGLKKIRTDYKQEN